MEVAPAGARGADGENLALQEDERARLSRRSLADPEEFFPTAQLPDGELPTAEHVKQSLLQIMVSSRAAALSPLLLPGALRACFSATGCLFVGAFLLWCWTRARLALGVDQFEQVTLKVTVHNVTGVTK